MVPCHKIAAAAALPCFFTRYKRKKKSNKTRKRKINIITV
jgi:hypothetical protein